ncbi:hypothetical protein BK635_17425 [Pseudomonas chlororaphis]|uniref:hypothetical protein n=1 Tax=Pseudomonas chlororaphis TaxID=587753 RepID=UPI000F49F645|nr:hypothetical protein [Pseudomonas chlororaphis]RON80081.1 hypothetical protein BK635_17425 [Pseudomonas chlororaphis]WDH32469.1 hypothetical protein PUP62_16540 [Pseudomonas chlororaphis]WDH38553.1 hypothetical protein PUP51_16545 [Pseudomonas chlororaphis]
MSITIKITLATGESAQGLDLELLSDGAPVARATIDEQGRALFDAPSALGQLAVRVDRSGLEKEQRA